MAIVLWLGGFQVGLYAQNATKLSPKVMAAMNEPLAELKDDDPPLTRVKKERSFIRKPDWINMLT